MCGVVVAGSVLFVIMSPSVSLPGHQVRVCSFILVPPHTKWYRLEMCLVCFINLSFRDIWHTDWLSLPLRILDTRPSMGLTWSAHTSYDCTVYAYIISCGDGQTALFLVALISIPSPYFSLFLQTGIKQDRNPYFLPYF